MKLLIIMNRIINVIFVLLLTTSLYAQVSTSSPYSRFGLGDLKGTMLPEYNSLGGGVTSLVDEYSINPYNPATFSFININSFLLTTGGEHINMTIDNGNINQTTNNTSFSHLAIAFPINNKTGASIGMLPYSNIGYDINTLDEEYNTSLLYSGEGGITKVYFGSAYKLSDNLSFGANASYLFGGLSKRKKVVYQDETFFNSRSNQQINIQGYYYELGILYKHKIIGNQEVNFGLTVNNNSSIRAKRTYLLETFEYSGTIEIPKDTFQDFTEWGFLTLPKNINAGISYSENNKLLIIVDYSSQNWNEYTFFEEIDNLQNSSRFSVGAKYIPDYNSVTNFYKRMEYRFGCSYYKTPLQFNDNQLQERSVSIGLGIPIKKSRTQYDFSIILGDRGTTEDNLLKERFVRFGLSVSYDGLWFVKRKYD